MKIYKIIVSTNRDLVTKIMLGKRYLVEHTGALIVTREGKDPVAFAPGFWLYIEEVEDAALKTPEESNVRVDRRPGSSDKEGGRRSVVEGEHGDVPRKGSSHPKST